MTLHSSAEVTGSNVNATQPKAWSDIVTRNRILGLAVAAICAVTALAGVAKAYPTNFVGGSGGWDDAFFWNSGYANGIHGRSGSEIDAFGVYNSVSLAASPQYGGSGGSFFNTMCSTNYVMVGLRGRAGSRVDAVGPTCVHKDDVNKFSGSQRLEFPAIKGGTGGTYYAIRCAQGNGMYGFYGRFGSRVDALAGACRL